MYYKALGLCFGRSKDSYPVCICSTKHWVLGLVGHQIEALWMYAPQSIGFGFGRSKDSGPVCICTTKHWFSVLVGHQIEALCMYVLQSIVFCVLVGQRTAAL